MHTHPIVDKSLHFAKFFLTFKINHAKLGLVQYQ